MDDAQLSALLADLESERVERKAALSDKDKICQAICAFANDISASGESGVIFLGATDDGKASNLAISDALVNEVASIRSDGNILPLPQMTVEIRALLGAEMIVIAVAPSPAPPVRFKGRCWIRVGSRRAQASIDEERRLSERRIAGDLPFDARPVPSATLDDLDLGLFTSTYLPQAVALDVLEANGRSIDQQLSSLRFTTNGSPTAAGLLTIGKQPSDFLPGAYIQFRRVAGSSLEDPTSDVRELRGPLIHLLPELELIVKSHIEVASNAYAGSVERRTPAYPLIALREILRNAVLHRNYETSAAPVRVTWFDNRIEIISPGGPYGQATPENFGSPGVSDYRNPYLAEMLKSLGYVQKFGAGLQAANSALVANVNPPAEFAVSESHVFVTLWAVQ